jgi:hypothetical protein
MGRGALIDEAVACDQLDRSLDVTQRVANGLGTNLQPTPGAAGEALRPTDTFVEQIARERLELLRRQNRKAAIDEAITTGRLVAAEAAGRATGKAVTHVINLIEAALPEMATDVAAQFKVPQHEVLLALRRRLRDVRAAGAEKLRAETAGMPKTVEFELGEPSDADPASPQ